MKQAVKSPAAPKNQAKQKLSWHAVCFHLADMAARVRHFTVSLYGESL